MANCFIYHDFGLRLTAKAGQLAKKRTPQDHAEIIKYLRCRPIHLPARGKRRRSLSRRSDDIANSTAPFAPLTARIGVPTIHLSEENNSPEIAVRAFASFLDGAPTANIEFIAVNRGILR